MNLFDEYIKSEGPLNLIALLFKFPLEQGEFGTCIGTFSCCKGNRLNSFFCAYLG